MVPCVLNLPGQVANRVYGISLRPKPKLTSGSLSLSECGDQSCLFWYAPFLGHTLPNIRPLQGLLPNG